MADSFFSDPSKKRKRPARQTSVAKRQNTKASRKLQKPAEESSSDIDEEEVQSDIFEDSSANESEQDEESSSEEEDAGESAADKRRRMAKQYLSELQAEAETYEFDAKDLDDDIIASRLQKDVSEQQGHVYQYIGDKLELDDVEIAVSRVASKGLTGVAVRYPYAYTVSKDMELVKWDISDKTKKPQKMKFAKGGRKYTEISKEQMNNGHCGEILAVAVSPDGRYVVTGARDKRIIIWSSENLAPVRVMEIRDRRGEVLGLAFRRNSDQLYAACADLKIRTYSVNQLAQLETLYGHQDLVVDIAALAQERCVTVGSRDRTAMLWKIAEETRLTFRGGDTPKAGIDFYAEGSIDCVSMIDDSHFVTGSDNGNICLWSLAKKKPTFIQRQAHGLEPEKEVWRASAETNPDEAKLQVPKPQPYWITAICAIPYSDLILSGSWNGEIKVWKLEKELRKFNLIGTLDRVKGVVTKIDAHLENDSIRVFASLSKEHRLGRWVDAPGALEEKEDEAGTTEEAFEEDGAAELTIEVLRVEDATEGLALDCADVVVTSALELLTEAAEAIAKSPLAFSKEAEDSEATEAAEASEASEASEAEATEASETEAAEAAETEETLATLAAEAADSAEAEEAAEAADSAEAAETAEAADAAEAEETDAAEAEDSEATEAEEAEAAEAAEAEETDNAELSDGDNKVSVTVKVIKEVVVSSALTEAVNRRSGTKDLNSIIVSLKLGNKRKFCGISGTS
ncbi:hypothetical protein OGAPHI_004435 [Ogataea philodendri]|uniref:Ribosomal RNA-processing protein 9 n=2 Tax=Ogataea TaxID=461281 RepID=A0A9P8T5S8_9ASCO|nr:uncharacterized protein OGAPHI_004435 [Ogataea philodendri]KAH3666246.1 hypothetical protein OGAPHI_004435 [Ogataea philodendri]